MRIFRGPSKKENSPVYAVKWILCRRVRRLIGVMKND
jgi:hypothetical protein